MKGAKLLLECLKREGVDTLFGYPGGAVIPLYDALYGDKDFKHIRTAHEQGAVHAADGYARSTGKIGVCFVTSGPGATNTVTGLATAYMDSSPLLVISGQVSTDLLGKDSFQEVDITGITFSVTKHNFLIRDVKDIPEVLHKACKIAREGRPGPVLIDVPKDVFLAEWDFDMRNYKNFKHNQCEFKKNNEMEKVIEIINNSKKPVIYAGGGVNISNASKELLAFAEKGDIPVVSTLMGLGSVNRNHELSLGLVGMHGFKENNMAVANCDLLLAIGARFSDRVIGDSEDFASKAKIVHIDIDSSEIDKNVNADFSLLGDLKFTLAKLGENIKENNHKSWRKTIEKWEIQNISKEKFHPKNILEAFNNKLGENAIVATDVGQHQMWTAQYWKFNHSHSFITSGGLGTMGFGLGAAIGAKIGNNKDQVLLVTGDGSFRMNSNELFTVSKYNIPITILLINNTVLGMVRQWQRMFFGGRYSETDNNFVDYVKLVQAYGIEAHCANNMGELNEVLNKASLGEKPVFIQCNIDKDESVYPIVPPGKAIYNVLMEG
ncbi:acetolactate synthase large subunit [Clostridium acetireducens DSM 10703]|uniref:Acetolactate synthase n=1 Tax=Clostridium acetireducens DSM 10703 TaxID=1121290 RepID=A0A1E8EXK4_9CLOT|nr:biosynthetic-type acetolactate synthase large subunit [Clostridium acetireducens]OFI05537.1 acetolactate synthase large subunit [Clostridium acetireducens DSM 10703]